MNFELCHSCCKRATWFKKNSLINWADWRHVLQPTVSAASLQEEKNADKDEEEEEEDAQEVARKKNISLLDQHTELKKIAEGKATLWRWCFFLYLS